MSRKKRVLILCTGNSARSQMAEGLLRHDGGDQFEVESAGIHASFVRPRAIEVMGEIGIDISNYRSKSLEEFAGQAFDYVITVCDNANELCPIFPGAPERIHWSVADPVNSMNEAEHFRNARDELRTRLRDFINTRVAG